MAKCRTPWHQYPAGEAVARGAIQGWRKLKTDWETWTRCDLAGEDVVRLILDGTVVRTRPDRKATNISLLVVLGVHRDRQKVLLLVRNMGGESEAAWRDMLDALSARGLRTPKFLPTQRCTVHKHRNLLAHAPEALHELHCRRPQTR